MKNILSEPEFETHIRSIIQYEIINKYSEFVLLDNKKAVDIMFARNSNPPKIYFLELKYLKKDDRTGIGQTKGRGFQPEILSKKIDYFEVNLRWIIGNENSEECLFLSNQEVRKYLMGKGIKKKQNNLKKSVFKSEQTLNDKSLINAIKNANFI